MKQASKELFILNEPIIVLFRRDLRVFDNPALHSAANTGRPLICAYIWETEQNREMGAASKWWLYYSLQSLKSDLNKIDLNLTVRKGLTSQALDILIKQTGASSIYWNRRYEIENIETDTEIKSDLTKRGLSVKSFNANLLSEPWSIKTKTGNYYKVFTPYWREAKKHINTEPLPKPNSALSYHEILESLDLDSLNLLPKNSNWGNKIKPYWTVGSEGALNALSNFANGPIKNYEENRNRPDIDNGTSKLSPHLAFGEISPRQIWHFFKNDLQMADKYLTEIGWREFSYVLLYNNPKLADDNFKKKFNNFRWQKNNVLLDAWKTGNTGYPFVDAGMRQLWKTGWQHNRVRMVTASFLIKHLLIDWREGEKWFYNTLVDADPASNASGWQWVAGSGADASPYFRIFNPFSQGEKFDPDGEYIKKFIPELKNLPKKYIHRPWDAPTEILQKANVKLGSNYPKPVVEHKFARKRALEAYAALKSE